MPVTTTRGATSLEAGQRDRWVTIEAYTPGVTASGFPAGTWAPLATVAMSRRPASATERLAASIPSAALQTIWGAPYRLDLDPDLVDVPATRRLVYQGRRYDIQSADLIGRRRGIELLTLAGSKVPTSP